DRRLLRAGPEDARRNTDPTAVRTRALVFGWRRVAACPRLAVPRRVAGPIGPPLAVATAQAVEPIGRSELPDRGGDQPEADQEEQQFAERRQFHRRRPPEARRGPMGGNGRRAGADERASAA